MRLRFSASMLALGLCLSAGPAFATQFCMIAKTRDGFVALRDNPSPSGKILARMGPDDEVQLADGRKGDWQRVIYWKGDDRLKRGYDKHTATGWVHRKLISDCG